MPALPKFRIFFAPGDKPGGRNERRWGRRRCSSRRGLRLLAGIPILLVLLTGCIGSGTFRAYEGELRSELSTAVITGQAYLRQDWLNRYVDSVRFQRVDDIPVEESLIYNSVEVAPGFHEVEVFFYWDLGNQRGLTQALVQYAATRESMSRTLRFNARAGGRYLVRAQPVFGQGRREITNLSHVNFWVEDSDGNVIVTREQGRYIPGEDEPR